MPSVEVVKQQTEMSSWVFSGPQQTLELFLLGIFFFLEDLKPKFILEGRLVNYNEYAQAGERSAQIQNYVLTTRINFYKKKSI